MSRQEGHLNHAALLLLAADGILTELAGREARPRAWFRAPPGGT